MDKKNIIIAILILLIVILGGLYFFNQPREVYVNPETSSATNVSQEKKSEPVVQETTKKKQPKENTCAVDLAKQLKADNTAYEKGTVLIVFQNTATLSDAKSLLEKNEVKIKDEAVVNENFGTTHRVTGLVTLGKELEIVCLLKTNPAVKYIGVNELFQLHQ